MKITKTLFCLFLIVISVHTNAQKIDYVAYGYKIGLGTSNLSGVSKYGERIPGTNIISPRYRASPLPAAELGGTVQMMLVNNFMMQFDFSLATSGTRIRHSHYVENLVTTYLSVYPYAGTKIPLTNNFRFVVGIGPYIGCNVAGLYSETTPTTYLPKDYPRKKTLVMYGDAYKDFDWGASAMLGIEIYNYQITLNYSHGLMDIVNNDHKLQTRAYKIGFVYFVD